MERLTQKEIIERFDNPWVSSYKRILTLTDNKEETVELIEYHPCPTGSQWMINQYQKTSPLVIKAIKEANKHIYTLKKGKVDMELKPSLKAAGIQEVEIKDNEIRITHAGLAGAGVGAARCRGKAEGITGVELYDKGGGSKIGKATIITPKLTKIIIGVDDTDTKEEGATWTLANNIAQTIEDKKIAYYLDHITCQLYPKNPNKTQNCVSIALVFAVKEENKEKLIQTFKKILKETTLSDKTTMVIQEGFTTPKNLKQYAIEAKKSMKTVKEAQEIAKNNDIRIEYITGKEGIIGAVAAIGLYNDIIEAAKIYSDE
ncbi:MAG: DUF1743 domain-containing protein [Methanobacteriaceae archaeon]|nr:DUF1743 domain-containing protein [Methanobacteriaceae archaeon]